MIKGITKNVILVRPSKRELFEEAIFILPDKAPEISDQCLISEANRLIGQKSKRNKLSGYIFFALGCVCGIAVSAIICLQAIWN